FGFFAFAGLIAVFGLAVTDFAVFFWLQPTVGPASATAIVALADFGVAGLVLITAINAKPAAELELAFELRRMAVASLQVDARGAKSLVDGFVHNPLDVAAQTLLVPTITSLLNLHRSKKTEG